MKFTLLDMVQTILSSLDSDEVNSVNDSTESMQVAKIVRAAYFDILTRANLPEHYSLVSLEASTDLNKPVLMTMPDTVAEMIWLKYNNATLEDTDIQMRPVIYQPLEEFLEGMHNLDASATTVDTFTHSTGANTITFLYLNDKAPSYYTTFDDYTVIFDSYDNTVDTTLQKSKTLAYAKNVIPFTMSDTFTPDLDEHQFPLLLNEAKSLAWAELKQAPHQKAEMNARRGWTNLQSSKFRTERQSLFDRLPNYGRK